MWLDKTVAAVLTAAFATCMQLEVSACKCSHAPPDTGMPLVMCLVGRGSQSCPNGLRSLVMFSAAAALQHSACTRCPQAEYQLHASEVLKAACFWQLCLPQQLTMRMTHMQLGLSYHDMAGKVCDGGCAASVPRRKTEEWRPEPWCAKRFGVADPYKGRAAVQMPGLAPSRQTTWLCQTPRQLWLARCAILQLHIRAEHRVIPVRGVQLCRRLAHASRPTTWPCQTPRQPWLARCALWQSAS